METVTFSPDLAIREAQTIIDNSPTDPYTRIATMLQGFRKKIRREAAQAICAHFNLDFEVLRMDLDRVEADARREREMIAKKDLSLPKYIELIERQKIKMKTVPGAGDNGSVSSDPQEVMLECIYDMLRHLVWKMTDSRHDIEFMALVEMSWNKAKQEASC